MHVGIAFDSNRISTAPMATTIVQQITVVQDLHAMVTNPRHESYLQTKTNSAEAVYHDEHKYSALRRANTLCKTSVADPHLPKRLKKYLWSGFERPESHDPTLDEPCPAKR
eukprot:2123564-Amphidinium_carterae.1